MRVTKAKSKYNNRRAHYRGAHSIKLTQSIYTMEDDTDYHHGLKVGAPVTQFGVEIDGKPVDDVYCMSIFFDLFQDRKFWSDSQDEKGAYFLTCSCGCAGCAGIWFPVTVRKKRDTVQWVGRKREGYPKGVIGTGEQVVYFKRDQYEKIQAQIIDFCRKNPFKIVNILASYECYGCEFLHMLEELEKEKR